MRTKIFTDDDFAAFEAKVRELIHLFGMYEWHLMIAHEQIGDRVCAQTQYNVVAKTASIRLTKQVEGDFGLLWEPERLAMHEVLHLVLCEYCETTAKMGSSTHDLVIAQEHGVLNRLMRAL